MRVANAASAGKYVNPTKPVAVGAAPTSTTLTTTQRVQALNPDQQGYLRDLWMKGDVNAYNNQLKMYEQLNGQAAATPKAVTTKGGQSGGINTMGPNVNLGMYPGVPDAPGGGGGRPVRTEIGDSLQKLKAAGLIPEYQDVTFTPIQGIQSGFGDDYYNNIAKSSEDRLKKSYFTNDDSMQKQLTNQMNKRGLIGSGIEAGNTTDLFKSFGEEMSSLSSDLAKMRAENDYDLAKYNKQIESDNMKLGLDTAFKNRDAKNFISQLGLSAAGDDARSATEFDTKMYASDIDYEKAKADQLSNIMDSLQQLGGNRDINEDNRRQYLEQINDLMYYLGYSDEVKPVY